MRKKQRAFTLVELLSVVAILALGVLLVTPAVFEDRHYNEVGLAVKRAGAIAAAIDTGRALGVVSPYEDSLREFIDDHEGGNVYVTKFMSSIKADVDVLGIDQKDFYKVKVGQYSVEVSFTLEGDQYKSYVFPSSRMQEGTKQVNGVDVDTVTWTVGPTVSDGISVAHMTNLYMNNGK